jgi:AcrR family transcriptional regulator
MPSERKRAARNADATRARIISAAQISFSQNSYEGVGVREVATQAGVDPALVIRYFGSKQGLFRAIAEQAFQSAELLVGTPGNLPQRASKLLVGRMDTDAWRSGYDPLRLLSCSIGSATAGPILGEYLERDFVQPLAEAVGGKNARERASVLCAQIVGFALMRVALTANRKLQRAALKRFLEAALERLLTAG